MKKIHRIYLLTSCLALLSCSQEQQYFVKVETDNGLYPRVSIKAPNDSMANVYGFRAFVAALNVFEEGDGNSSDLSNIDYSFMPRGVTIFNSEGKDITNITQEIYKEEMKNHVPSQIRLAALKRERERLDSLSIIAWGDAKFGMTQKEVRSTAQFRNMQKDKYFNYNGHVRFAAPKSTTKQIKEAFDLFYWEPTLYAEFYGKNNDELIEVTLVSHDFEWDYYKYMVDDYKTIANYLSEQYGKPEKSNLDIERYSLKDDDFQNIATWKISSKTITLYISSNRSKYRYLFCIDNYEYPKTKNEEAVKNSEIKKQKQEGLRANTF